MSGVDTFSMAIKNLYKRKLRTFLTVLGVIIGACVIIIMISLSLAINQGFEERMMTTPNATVINLFNRSWNPNPWTPVMDDALLTRIQDIPGVQVVTPWLQVWSIRSVIGRFSADIMILGVYPEALPHLGYELAEGTWLDPDDEWGMLFGSNVPGRYMTQRQREQQSRRWMTSGIWSETVEGAPGVNVLRDRIRISVDWNFGWDSSTGFEDGYVDDWAAFFAETEGGISQSQAVRPYNVHGVGILAPGTNWEATDFIFMNVRTAQLLSEESNKFRQGVFGGSGVNPGMANQQNDTATEGYEQVYVKVHDVNSLDMVIEKLEEMGFVDNESMWFSASYVRELRETMSSLQMLLGITGIICLVLATIGIANTMIMATVERTKEIGVMKVIGASLRDIRKLFLAESAIIGFLGGVVGVGLSYIVSHALNTYGLTFFNFINLQNWHGDVQMTAVSIIPAWLSGLSLLFAALIGLVAGFWPAQRATKLSALAAIRTD